MSNIIKPATMTAMLCGLATGVAPMALAQSEQRSRATLEEVVVTAQRREESLQEVPVAVTAYSNEDLDRLQIVDVSSLQNSTPTMVVSPFPNDPGQASIALRGFFSPEGIITVDPAVGLYVDGVYIARSTGANLDMVDLGRVEVLRGPQGTLFGRNTMGGAVNLVTNKPVDVSEGYLRAGAGNYNAWEVGGMVNLPLSDTAALRVAGKRSEREGFAKSRITGVDLNDNETDYLRAQLLLDPNERFSALLTGDYSKISMSGQWTTLIDDNPLGRQFVGFMSGGTDSSSNYVDPYTDRPAATTDSGYENEAWGLSATLTYDSDFATLKSITAYRELDQSAGGNDLDATPYDIIQGLENTKTQEQLSQELQLFGKALDNRLDWIVGAYYFQEEGLERSRAHFLFPIFVPFTNVTDGDGDNSSMALYGQLTYNLTEQLQLQGGVRYTRDSRELALRNRLEDPATGNTVLCSTPGGSAPDCQIKLDDKDFSYIPFVLGANYFASDDLMLYGKWSRGFRAGGFNIRGASPEALEPFDEERVDSFEIGMKGDFLNNRLRVNAAAFHQRFDEIQVIAVVGTAGGGTGTAIVNAAEAEINGLELEVTALVGDLRLSGTYGYLDAKYTDVESSVTQLNEDTMFRSTPENTLSAALAYEIPTAFGELLLHTDYAWTDKVSHGLTPPGPGSIIEDSYGLWNAKLRARFERQNLEVSLWGRNLADKEYLVGGLDISSIGVVAGFPGNPRTFGITGTWHY